jgi:hypothetical protein
MSQSSEAFRAALAAAEQLPRRQRRLLAERLFASTALDARSVIVHLERLPLEKQARLRELMDKSNEGALTRTERKEITRLGLEVDQTMLSNSLVLARSLRPELFDKTGQPMRRRFRHALTSQSPRRNLGSRERSNR